VETGTHRQALPSFQPAGMLARPSPGALRRLLQNVVDRLHCGALTVVLPDGATVSGRGSIAGPEVTVHLHRWRPLLRLALRGDIGLAESYVDGDWSTADLAAILDLGLRNEKAWPGGLNAAWPLRLLHRLAHRRRDNTRRGSRRNIEFHYDLGNAFYRQWLDADLIYSSGIYRDRHASLETAQAAKLDCVIELLDLPAPGSSQASVLEIGCGWGALACAMATRRSAAVTGITLSNEQLAHARQRVRREGLASCVDLRLQDYRDTVGHFDRIVSIEMIEAVGERHWPAYFRTVRERLKPRGAAVIQAITIDDACFDHYRRNTDFIQHFIFPGGMLPSPDALQREAQRAGLRLEVVETFGDSYAATLVEWRHRFRKAWPAISAQGFDERFRRLWEYYLCYCEAGFRSRRVDVGLFRLTHAG
jgi:cyclopropane-fatty-acyl-phospholipid synthase